MQLSATIHSDNAVSKPIHINRGMRQGDTISPKIFTAAIEEEVFKRLNLEKNGVNVDGEYLTDLRFADDVTLTTPSLKDMEVQLNSWNSESKKIDLKIHKEKNKVYDNRTQTNRYTSSWKLQVSGPNSEDGG